MSRLATGPDGGHIPAGRGPAVHPQDIVPAGGTPAKGGPASGSGHRRRRLPVAGNGAGPHAKVGARRAPGEALRPILTPS